MNAPKKRGLMLNINTICNFKCTYCYQAEQNSLATGRQIDEDTLSGILQLLRNNQAITFVQIFGGEPLLSEKTILILCQLAEEENSQRASEYHIHLQIVTNGSIFPEWLYPYKHLVTLQVSIDGGRENHDKYRRDVKDQGTYDSIIETIDKLYDAEFSFHLHSVVNNIKPWMQSLRTLSTNLKDREISFGYQWNMSSTSVFNDIYNYLYLHHRALPWIKKHTSLRIRSPFERESDSPICYGGDGFLAINSIGQVYTCEVESPEFHAGTILPSGQISFVPTYTKDIEDRVNQDKYRFHYLPRFLSQKILNKAASYYTLCNIRNKQLTGDQFIAPFRDLFQLWVYRKRRSLNV